MKCRELHASFEDDAQFGLSQVTNTSDAAKHIATCSQCRNFVQERRELAASLGMVRETAPDVPPSLDGAVLAEFRKRAVQVGEPRRAAHFWQRMRVPVVLEWSAVVAAIVLAAVLLAPKKRIVPEVTTDSTEREVISPQPASEVSPAMAHPNVSPRKKKVAQSHISLPRRGVRGSTAPTAVAASGADENRVPPGFRSLMFCDPLSCSGAMDMIRVQLPRSIAGGTGRSDQPGDVVFADVLVGSDGIARGIRMVQ